MVTAQIARLILANMVTLLGGVVQGSVGMGGSVVTVPFLGLIDPLFVPVPTLVVGLARAIMVLRRDFSGLDKRGLRPILVGVIPGAILGALLIIHISNNTVVVIASCFVLIAIGISARGKRLKDSTLARFFVGMLSGCMSSISSISGPAIALFYLDAKNNTIRSTMSLFFIVTDSLSILFLIAVGKFGGHELLLSVEILPGAMIGYFISAKGIRSIDKRSVRPAIFVIAVLSAVFAISQKLL